MSTRIGIACEDNGHFRAVTLLVDDALIANHDWLDGILADCRSWRGLADGEPWYKYDPDDANDIRPIYLDGQRIAPHGYIRGEPPKLEAGMWRRVLLLFSRCAPPPDVVILARDMDGYSERESGLAQVRHAFEWPFKIAVAAAEPEVEAWHVAGFIAGNEHERRRLQELREQLSFDPTTQSHRLTSHPNDARTDAKRALAHLCEGDADREAACLANRDLLRERGTVNGLTSFLAEIDHHIVPLFGARR